MVLPLTPIEFQGGCNCHAIRYRVNLPTFSERPANPYVKPGVEIGDVRLPMVAIDYCNDCRRATSSVIPMWLCTHLSTVSTSCLPREAAIDSNQYTWRPASEVFDPANGADKTSFLMFYKSSAQRTRSFCGRCGTNMSIANDAGSIPEEWGWPKMLDIPLGTVDREYLEKDWFVPERRIWCQFGIDWVTRLVVGGAEGIPAHPTYKINEDWKKKNLE